ncbi:dimethylamine monooxygenase subunit DmmA family protein [Conexibacter stalactiti]|uniref:Dimethylamine monooxygenase subunit DmmA family protein n=1 Tax=Conexibacter stalactiti TaxID=1940611 RepID=A0ABU4HLE6_9ACTN|nr:dimethylamine monooxygenase subunit DmmA family protein [Conexibacter stalactiti]MDW5594075.1 dimethylamine monooxygenase subunit DmmA family protein [Conexibacter stalactiti]MEC5034717.1 dimethylamine monooxygenase subunit DmmA family protein [Conexibacter stalactiti]
MSERHTSVPRWAELPRVDPGARRIAIVSIGDTGRDVARGWADATRQARTPLWSAHGETADARVVEALREQLRHATVGWRLMLAGPELDLLRLRAEAVAAGALGEEVRQHVTSATRRRVWCTHCRTIAEHATAVGDEVGCTGCGRTLLVYHHVSRRLGAYMGFMADAEEPR